MTRGGRRPGAGRPRGTGTGRTVKPVMFHLPPAIIEAIDACRGGQSRSEWVTAAIAAHASPGARWPVTISTGNGDGLIYTRTGKVGTRADTGLAVAEYDRSGSRVWLGADGKVYPE